MIRQFNGWTINSKGNTILEMISRDDRVKIDPHKDYFAIRIFDGKQRRPVHIMDRLDYKLYCGKDFNREKLVNTAEYRYNDDPGWGLISIGKFTVMITIQNNDKMIVESFVDKGV